MSFKECLLLASWPFQWLQCQCITETIQKQPFHSLHWLYSLLLLYKLVYLPPLPFSLPNLPCPWLLTGIFLNVQGLFFFTETNQYLRSPQILWIWVFEYIIWFKLYCPSRSYPASENFDCTFSWPQSKPQCSHKKTTITFPEVKSRVTDMMGNEILISTLNDIHSKFLKMWQPWKLLCDPQSFDIHLMNSWLTLRYGDRVVALWTLLFLFIFSSRILFLFPSFFLFHAPPLFRHFLLFKFALVSFPIPHYYLTFLLSIHQWTNLSGYLLPFFNKTTVELMF